MQLFKGIFSALIIIIVGIGLPVTGWGIFDLSSFIESPFRLSLIILIIIQGIAIGIKIINDRAQNVFNKGRDDRYYSVQSLAPVINRTITLFIYFFAAYSDKNNFFVTNDLYAVRFVGIILYMIGILLTWLAHNALGKYHSIEVTIQKDHQLIMNGLYKYIRNPVYSGIILSTLGFGMIFRSIIGISLIPIIIGLFIWRIYAEEKVLATEFKNEWTVYCKRTYRLIPFIF
jgi:protein-S-isoprenylcysteine O-methyltransferase Ste14